MCVAAFPGHCNSLAGALLVAQACNRRTQLPENAALSPLTAAGTALRSAPNSKGVLDLEQNNPKLYYKPQIKLERLEPSTKQPQTIILPHTTFHCSGI